MENLKDDNLNEDPEIRKIALGFYLNMNKFRNHTKSFMTQIESHWGESFRLSDELYIFTLVLINLSEENIINTPIINSATYTLIKKLYDRAGQQYLEIISLLRNGFAEGASARWRSMYEILCITGLIVTSNERDELATSYTLAAEKNPSGGYEWAKIDSRFNDEKGKLNFAKIEKALNLADEESRALYKISSSILHASSKGTHYRIGRSLTDYSLTGLSATAINSATNLMSMTRLLFTFSLDDPKKYDENLHIFYNNIHKQYTETEEKLKNTQEPAND